ncbi:cation:proton antiporter [Nonomuraea guangzhouensis]|uniref:Cation:proton antiporter n=1 Tax=Nonomuraea guangzhouensis TaxID=1291555 RepID=A0ABW4GAE3_9ACTN|nr:cation:proton antiporter [Nonomuraea guangzhouensis]
MIPAEGPARIVLFAVVLAAVLLLALAGRLLAGALRQPAVIGEVALGMAAGPLVLAVAGPGVVSALPLDWLGWCGHTGLVLFLVGVIHELRAAPPLARGRAVGWTTVGALAVPMLAGAAVAAWALAGDEPGLRGTAPAPALIVFLAVSLSVTAVPVLARILSERGLVGTRAGVLAMTVAIVTDAAAWLLVALAVSLAAGGLGGVVVLTVVTAVALLGALAVRRVLGASRLLRLVARGPRVAAVLLAVWALVAAAALRSWGLTEILGAALAALALPLKGTRTAPPESGAAGDADDEGPWTRPVRAVAGVGRLLVPVFFVVTGFSVFAEPFAVAPWSAIVLVTLLGMASKIGGAYAGARFGGEPREVALGLGVLLNTRGLTELVVLQIGHEAGILTPAMFLALAVMALVTTAATGPSYALLQRPRRPLRTAPAPAAQKGSL